MSKKLEKQKRKNKKEMKNKVNKKPKSNLEKSAENTVLENHHPIQWKQSIGILITFTLISFIIFFSR